MNTCFLSLTLAILPLPPSPQEIPPKAVERIGAHLEALGRLGFSGAVLVTQGGETLFQGAYGWSDRAARRRATLDTVWPLGSISKHFTAAAVLRLVDEERLGLGDRMDRWFDDLPADKAGITVRQLLTHTSGLPESGPVEQEGAREGFVRATMGMELAFSPGKGQGYSNLGYGILAVLVELASEQPFERYLESEILDRAGMRNSGIARAFEPERLAHGYIDASDTGTLLGEGRSWWLKGAGGMLATVADMAHWVRALGQGEILSVESLEAMTSRQVGDTGYGTGIRDSPLGKVVGHNGSNDVFSADFAWFPEADLMVFAAANDADLYAFDVTPAIQALLFGEGVVAPPRTTEVEPGRLEALAGTWELEAGGRFQVRVAPEGGSLLVGSSDARAAARLHPLSGSQEGRRASLASSLEGAFVRASEGDLEPLRGLIAPFTPPAAFAERYEALLGGWMDELGALEEARAVPGRNRFGEVALVAVLGFAEGERMIEYSFGPREVGSIRFVDAFPLRRLHPITPSEFQTYETGGEGVVRLSVELSGVDDGTILRLGELRARRVD